MDPCRLVTGADVHKKPLADRRSDGVGGDAVCLRTFTAFAETEHGDFLYSPPVEGWLLYWYRPSKQKQLFPSKGGEFLKIVFPAPHTNSLRMA